MARLPTLDDLGPRPTPVSNRTIASNEQAGAVGAAVADLGQTVSKIGQHFLEKEDILDQARAKTALVKGSLELQKQLQDDPDYETAEQRYAEGMKRVRDEAGQHIRHGGNRQAFEADSELDAMRGGLEVSKYVAGRRSGKRIGDTVQLLKDSQDIGLDAPDEATREQNIKTVFGAIDALRDRGDITADKAVEWKFSWREDYARQRVQLLKERGDLDGALSAYRAYRPFLGPEVDMRLGEQLKDATENRKVLNYSDRYLEPAVETAPAGAMGGAMGVAGVQGLALVPPPSGMPRARPMGRSAYLAAVRTAENNTGDPNAKNTRSSASGNYQFTDSTFLKTYRATFSDGLTDKQILAKKNNPALQERLANVLTDQNEAALKAAGHTATGANLYLAHFAGAGGANKVLGADASASVSSVLGGKVVEANPFLRGKTVGWLREWAGRKVGGGAAAGSAAAGPNTYGGPVGPDLKDLEARINADAVREDWTPEFKAKVRATVMARANDMRIEANREREETFNRALAKADALGGTFTDVSQIGDDFYRSSATDQHRLRTMAQANLEAASKGVETAANGDAIRKLKVLAAGSPADAAKLAGINLAEYRPHMTASEYEEISVAQARAKADLLKPKPGEEPWNPRTGIQAAMSWGKEFGGVELKDDDDKFRVYRYMETRAREWSSANSGKKPTENEYQSFFREATAEVKVQRSMFGFDGLRSDTTGRSQAILSPNYKALIIRQFRLVHRRDPNPTEMQEWFDKMGEVLK